MFSIPKTREAALEVLGFNPKDKPGEGEIRKAYYKLVLKWHPDKLQIADKAQKEIAKGNTQAINQAYAILTGKEVAKVEENFNKMTVQEIMEFLFGSHLSSDGSKRRLYLFAALNEGLLLEATCFLVGGKINKEGELVKKEKKYKYVENINIRTKPNKQNIEHKAPLHYIIEKTCKNPNTGWETLLEETLQKRIGTENAVDTNISDKDGVSPMHIAARYGRVDLMEILVEHGADVNVLDNKQRSPLDEAADNNHIEAVKFLLGEGATISENVKTNVNQKKYRPEMIAMISGHPSFETKNQTTAESCKGNKTNPVSIPQGTATLKPMPEPTVMQDSASDNKQNNGQGSSSSPQETATSKPTPGPTIIPESTLNSNQNGTSKTSIITQSSSSDNSQSNNNTRSLLIGLAIVAGAVIGAVALYFFAPLIFGTSIGIGAQLGLGIAGAAIGGGIGYLTNVAISQCCSSKAHAA
ncbi:DnaJ domain,Ankyrin repeat-containing domain,Ankyrin repeat [Cinara cedri]|uniref:DnaJ domain,Ankyrin repeat-containing domain,Ankyrin repeat n=1 Tax=Cinara cedri TaxID=506608 RepID=A0A5E4NN46_9HEMI|nr:DnaJ domain,Ankyrin repeat-containing domain,Ankyrin repeat [Cinara cedri]